MGSMVPLVMITCAGAPTHQKGNRIADQLGFAVGPPQGARPIASANTLRHPAQSLFPLRSPATRGKGAKTR